VKLEHGPRITEGELLMIERRRGNLWGCDEDRFLRLAAYVRKTSRGTREAAEMPRRTPATLMI
jgi:hypothetical protein